MPREKLKKYVKPPAVTTTKQKKTIQIQTTLRNSASNPLTSTIQQDFSQSDIVTIDVNQSNNFKIGDEKSKQISLTKERINKFKA